jgi:hypothetical protein
MEWQWYDDVIASATGGRYEEGWGASTSEAQWLAVVSPA